MIKMKFSPTIQVACFIGMCAFLLACKTTKNYLDKETPNDMSLMEYIPSEDPDDTLSVVSFNIEYGERIQEALSEIRSIPIEDIDLLLLQEMDERGTAAIAEELALNYAYFPISFHRKYKRNFGNAILSRWPLSDPCKLVLPHERPFNKMKRGATSVLVSYGAYEIRVYSIHLETPLMSIGKRIDQLNFIISDMNAKGKADYMILGGDFNSMFKNEVKEIVSICLDENLNWHTKGIGFTSNRWNILRPTLDHIFSRGFKHTASGKLENYSASDHTPIWANLEILSSPN